MQQVYFDNASTSYPKPLEICTAIQKYLVEAGGSPGRSGHILSRKGEEFVVESRQLIAQIFNIKKVENICFTLNATQGLNYIIKGYLKNGDHVITTNLEHNSVLRPLEKLKLDNVIEYDVVESNIEGLFDLSSFENKIKKNTKLIVVNHASNVIGIISPIKEIISIAHKYDIKVLVDVSQTAGFLDIDAEALDVDFLVFTGHKSLLGPSGVGGIYIKDPYNTDIDTLIQGGTGGNSYSLVQPETLPEKFEAGTINYLGITALGESLKILIKEEISNIRKHELHLTEYLLKELSNIENITVYGTQNIDFKVPVISFNIKNKIPNEIASKLDSEFGIMTRPGLQCAPLVHKTLNTFPNGTIRISLGWKNTMSECDYFLQSIKDII